jgi:hypothetical protein
LRLRRFFPILRYELQRNAIAAPAFSGWRRTVIENVAMPAAATDTMILGARQDELEGRARGHLVPLSYFMAEVNSGKSQPTTQIRQGVSRCLVGWSRGVRSLLRAAR